jgi:tetratricopeptide (TPR) repeat protein
MAEAVGDGDSNGFVPAARRTADILEGDGRYADAVTAGARALVASIRIGERWNRSEIEGHLAVNLLRVGRTAEAEAHMADAATFVRGAEDLSGTAEAEWARAHFLAAGGDHDAADASFRAAIATVDPHEFAPLHAFFRLERAEFLLARKRIAEAAALLAEVERIAPPPPWNYLPNRRRALAAALAAERV